MSFQQIGGFYCLLFGAALMAEGECDAVAWQGPDTVNIDLNFAIQWAAPEPVNINLCAPLLGG